MLQKLFITGPVGSGKSTLAREIARRMGIQCTELDSLCYVPDDSPSGNRKRPVEERDALFSAALAEPRWVMEDAGRACFEEARLPPPPPGAGGAALAQAKPRAGALRLPPRL